MLVDMDDTIEDLLVAWLDWLNKKYKLNVQVDDVNEWDMTKHFPTLTKKQIYEPLTIEDFWLTVKPKEDAIEYLNKLNDEGFDIYIVTATDYRNIFWKFKYILIPYFPFIKDDHIITIHNKNLLIADVIVDDNPKNLMGNVNCKILFNANHNKSYKFNTRADNWEQCYSIIHNYYDNV